jgi:hypothetical protein
MPPSNGRFNPADKLLALVFAVLLAVLGYVWQQHVTDYRAHVDKSRLSVDQTDLIIDRIVEELQK